MPSLEIKEVYRQFWEEYLDRLSHHKRAEELKRLKWGMFICWSFSTFSGKEWTPEVKDAAFFKATDCYGNIFSLDVGPDYNGKLRDIDVQTLRRVGEMIKSLNQDPEGRAEIPGDKRRAKEDAGADAGPDGDYCQSIGREVSLEFRHERSGGQAMGSTTTAVP